MSHPVAVRAEGNQISGRVHLSFMLREGPDVMDLDITVYKRPGHNQDFLFV